MNTKYLFTAIAVVVILVVGMFIYNQRNDQDDVYDQTSQANNSNSENSNKNTNEESNANANANNSNVNNANSNSESNPDSNTPDGNDVAVFEIDYDGKAFSPSNVTIKNGDVVVFKNTSSVSFWPASGPHPDHTNYPEFDPKKAIGPGQSWQFKFTKSGTWQFHDHLNSSVFGKIVVE